MKIFIMIVCMTLVNISFADMVLQAPCNGGKFYNAQGRLEIRIDSNGKQYDAKGRYQGRTDNSGKVYDKNGKYQGVWRK